MNKGFDAMNFEVTGLLLAGGRGSRMGHVDKGLQAFQGQPMAQHVLARLAPQVQHLLINANQNLADYAALGHPVWPDNLSGFAGPLAGLECGLAHCSTPLLVSAPCDSPLLPLDLVQRLRQGLQDERADLAIAVTGAGATLQEHPVFCLLPVRLHAGLRAFLQSGGRKMSAWYGPLRVARVHFADEAAFHNLNTLAELQALQTPHD